MPSRLLVMEKGTESENKEGHLGSSQVESRVFGAERILLGCLGFMNRYSRRGLGLFSVDLVLRVSKIRFT